MLITNLKKKYNKNCEGDLMDFLKETYGLFLVDTLGSSLVV